MWIFIGLGTAFFSIPAGDAATTLTEYSKQSPYQLIFEYDTFKGVPTKAIHGRLEDLKALELMIEGTSITYEVMEERTIVVRRPIRPSHYSEHRPFSAERTDADAFSAELIGEDCQFGLLPARIAAERLGEVAGECWCCTYYNEQYRDYLFLKSVLTVAPDPVSPPDTYFCISLKTSNACPVFDGSLNQEWEGGVRDEIVIQSRR